MVATVRPRTKVAIPDGTIEARADTVEVAAAQTDRAEEVGEKVVEIQTNLHQDRVHLMETRKGPRVIANARKQMQEGTTWRPRQLMQIS